MRDNMRIHKFNLSLIVSIIKPVSYALTEDILFLVKLSSLTGKCVFFKFQFNIADNIELGTYLFNVTRIILHSIMITGKLNRQANYTELKDAQCLLFTLTNLGGGTQSLKISRYYGEGASQGNSENLVELKFPGEDPTKVKNILLAIFQSLYGAQDDFYRLYDRDLRERIELFIVASHNEEARYLAILERDEQGTVTNLFNEKLPSQIELGKPDTNDNIQPTLSQNDLHIAEAYLNILQDNLEKLYEIKLRELASLDGDPPEDVDPVRLWFFIEHWKSKFNEPLLAQFQEQMKRIYSELDSDEYRLDKPKLDSREKSSPNLLDHYLSLYQKEKERLKNKAFNKIVIQSEKYRQLQSLACILIDRIDESGNAANHRTETFLNLIGLRTLVVMPGTTHFNEELHNIVGYKPDRSVEPGTVVEVIKRGLRDIYTGEIVRKVFVITSS